jgi:hypothetical protein
MLFFEYGLLLCYLYVQFLNLALNSWKKVEGQIGSPSSISNNNFHNQLTLLLLGLENISAFLILSYAFHFRCAHFNLDDVQKLGHSYLKSCLWGWICILFIDPSLVGGGGQGGRCQWTWEATSGLSNWS